MAGTGREPKPDLSENELKAVLGRLSRDSYKGSGARAAAAMVSAMRGAPEASTPKAKAKRTVSARWVMRQLSKCGIDTSAALMRISQRQSKARRSNGSTAYSDSRMGLPISSGELARVQNQENGQPAKGLEETKGPEALGGRSMSCDGSHQHCTCLARVEPATGPTCWSCGTTEMVVVAPGARNFVHRQGCSKLENQQ